MATKDNNNNNNNSNNVAMDARAAERAEQVLVQSIMGLVLPTVAQLVEERSTARAGGAVAYRTLTEPEDAVFNKYRYLGYGPGITAAFVTVGGLFGGLRYAAYRRFLRHRVLPGSVESHVRSAAQRKHYAALDSGPAAAAPSVGGGGANKTRTKKAAAAATASAQQKKQATSSQPQQPKLGFQIMDSADLWTQMQLLLSGAVALLVGSVTANATFDTTAFFHDVSQLPLQPGQSPLCERLCPAIVEQRRKLLALDTLEPLHEAYLREQQQQQQQQQQQPNDDNNNNNTNNNNTNHSSQTQPQPQPPLSDLAVAVRRQNPAHLWNFPATEQLESAVALADHCERRIAFCNECRRRRHRVDASGLLVDVPEPGVPAQFVRLEEEEDADDETKS